MFANIKARSCGKTIRILVCGIVVSTLIACSSAGIFRRELVFTREDLQAKLTKKFPRKEKHPLMAVTFSNPEILLEPGAEAMSMRLDIKMAPRMGKQRKGRVVAQGGIEYRPQQGEFIIVNPRVLAIEFDHLKGKYQKSVQSAADRLVEQYLSEVAVYRLDQKDFKQKMAKLVLKSVDIKDGKLVVVLEL